MLRPPCPAQRMGDYVAGVPDLAHLIVADRRKSDSVWMPGHLVNPVLVTFEDLGMPRIVQIPNAYVEVHTCGRDSIFAGVPRYPTNSRGMTIQRLDQFTGRRVPNPNRFAFPRRSQQRSVF